MLGFLRFVGIVNAAVWFGSALFLSMVVIPAFSSSGMVNLLGVPRSGAAAQLIWDRYFLLQTWCGAIALAHLLVEWAYTGKPLERLTLWVVLGSFILVLLGGYWFQPKVESLLWTKYTTTTGTTTEQRQKAGRSLRGWNGVLFVTNVFITIGVLGHLWRTSHWAGTTRFVSAGKFRG